MQTGRPPYPYVHRVSVSDGGVPKRPVFGAEVNEDEACVEPSLYQSHA